MNRNGKRKCKDWDLRNRRRYFKLPSIVFHCRFPVKLTCSFMQQRAGRKLTEYTSYYIDKQRFIASQLEV